MFFACGIWCVADVSSVSPSSESNDTNLKCALGYYLFDILGLF